MKLIIEYDPWAERAEAQRMQAALDTLGMPAELCERRSGSSPPPQPMAPVLRSQH